MTSVWQISNEDTRGAAIQVEKRAKLTVQYTLFKENEARFGASIYTFGDIYVYDSTFRRNVGNVSCFGVLSNSTF